MQNSGSVEKKQKKNCKNIVPFDVHDKLEVVQLNNDWLANWSCVEWQNFRSLTALYLAETDCTISLLWKQKFAVHQNQAATGLEPLQLLLHI